MCDNFCQWTNVTKNRFVSNIKNIFVKANGTEVVSVSRFTN